MTGLDPRLEPRSPAQVAEVMRAVADVVAGLPEGVPAPSVDVYGWESTSNVGWHDVTYEEGLAVVAALPGEWKARRSGIDYWVVRDLDPVGDRFAEVDVTVWSPDHDSWVALAAAAGCSAAEGVAS